MIHGKRLEDGIALVPNRAIIVDPDGKLSIAVGAGGLDGAPLLEGKSLVLKGDTLVGEHEADGLSASLETKVNQSGHSFLLIRVKDIYD